jgi:hypothetical protein
MEILTQSCATPVNAVAHRVRAQQPGGPLPEDRFSYGLFLDSSLNPDFCPGLWRYQPGTGLMLATPFERFLDRIVQNTYDKNSQGLY